MTPAPSPQLPQRPVLLNEKFTVHSYDGGSFKSRAQYDVKNALIPILEPFHCSGSGTKFNLVLKCSEDFTLTHFYVSGPGPRCTEPVKSGLVWVMDKPPEVEHMKKYDDMSSEDLCEIVKGFRSVGSELADKGSLALPGLPDPSVYFMTDSGSREAEVELRRWREGKYIAIKFLDTHKDQVNIDVGIIALIGFWGRHSVQQVPLGPWMRRTVQQIWVHPHPLKRMFSSSGWVCDGRDFTGGCRSGQTDFHQSNVYTVTFRCTTSGFDLCEACAYDPTLGKVTETSVLADLEALGDPTLCKLAVTRIRNQWRRNWYATLPMYFQQGLLDVLVSALQKSTDATGARPEEERISQRASSAESQKRTARRALLQLTTELTQRLFGLCPGGDLNVNDLVWALCPEPEEHWDEGRVLQLPKAAPPDPAALTDKPSETAPVEAVPAPVGALSPSSSTTAAEGSATQTTTPAGESPATALLISWRDGLAPSRVQAKHVWKMTSDEDTMMATAGLFLEVSKGTSCDSEKVVKLLQQGADLMAANGEGCTALLSAVKSECSVEVLTTLLENGACPDVSNREGITPLQQVMTLQAQGQGDPERLRGCMEVLQRHGAVPLGDVAPSTVLEQLRDAFGLKMIGSLLMLQSPATLPMEVFEVVQLLFRGLPRRVVKQSLEPLAFRALISLFQHFVGGTDNVSTAWLGCRIMRAVYLQNDTTLQYLVRSHGAPRWTRRLAVTRDVAQCGLYRQPHHEKVTPEELSKEAKALCELFGDEGTENPEEWRANSKLAEVVAALDVRDGPGDIAVMKEALISFRELLKKTEKGTLNEERCTAYELEKSNMPGILLRFLKYHAPASTSDPIRHPSLNEERWAFFREAFSGLTKQTSKGLVRLMKALHAVIETGEAFPVWHQKKERGLKALTKPVQLKLRHVGTRDSLPPLLPSALQSQVAVMVEPLVPLSEVSRYVLRVTPTTDERFLTYCHELVGATIYERGSGESCTVLAFEVLHSDLPLPIHTVQRESGESQRLLLGMRDHIVVTAPQTPVTLVSFRVALCALHVVAGAEAFPGLLDELPAVIQGDQSVDLGKFSDTVRTALGQAACAAASQVPVALTIIAEERARVTAAAGTNTESEGTGSAEVTVDPTMRVHTVMIAVSDEVPFDLFWPMVREDIMGAVRELHPRGVSPQLEETVQAGVSQNGMGPVAQRLTLKEAETLAARVGHVVQTAVTVDSAAVQEAQRERSKGSGEAAIAVAGRVQFSPKSGETWAAAVVVGHGPPARSGPECFDLVDDKGVLWEKLPRVRVRIPPTRRESPSSVGTPIQAVLSQADLARIREHLRRRQEEWAERHASLGPGGASGPSGALGGASGSGGASERSSSRPTSAPAIAQRPRVASAGSLEASGASGAASRRDPSGGHPALASREASLGEVDAGNALEMVHFIEEEAIADEEFDDDGDGPRDPGEEGEEDDEDLPPLLEPSEAGDSQSGEAAPMPRLGGARPRDQSDPRDGDGASSMEEELRVLEQLRAMEQIISEVLDPHEGPSRQRREQGVHADDFLSTPMANLRIRMGGISDGRVETYQIRRASGGSRGSERPGYSAEALRGAFPAFVRAADTPNPTSSLDHPVVERLGAADLVRDDGDESMEPVPSDSLQPTKLCVRFCLMPAETEAPAPAAETTTASTTEAPATGATTPAATPASPRAEPIWLPPAWNLLKAMQFLHDQEHMKSQAFLVQALKKVPLDNWCLGYALASSAPPPLKTEEDDPMGAAPPSSARRREASATGAAHPARKRRRMGHEVPDDVAREMYSRFSAEEPLGPHALIARCGENTAVTDAIELLHLLKAQGPSLGVEPGLWVSSKLDRKLRYQLEDPLSVVSGTLPLWVTTLPRLCPFLFSLKTRKMLLKYTAFGPSFAVHWTQEGKVGSFLRRRATVQTELNAQTDPRKIQELSQELSNIEEHVVKSNFWLGTLQSTIVRMQKGEEFLRQSEVAMDLISSSGNLVEVQFDGENGFGSAVTQSFYVEVAQALQDRTTNKGVPLWVEDDDSTNSPFLLNRRGLMMQPLAEGQQRDEAVRRFRFLGRLMGQALREGFICPLPLAEEFFALVLGEPLGPANFPRPGNGSAGELCGVFADFAAELVAGEAQLSSSEEFGAWRKQQAESADFGERFLGDKEGGVPVAPTSFSQHTEALGVCFLVTGLSGPPLCPGGENMQVTVENIDTFVELAARFWFDAGISAQVEAFRAGLNDVFPFECLVAFSRSELREMFCGEDRIDWDEQALLSHLQPVGGLSDKSPSYKYLVAVLLEMDQKDRSRFLDFVSSCPRLPPGGIAKFHVDVFPDSTSKQGFPRSRACANQLYLPPYNSKEELHEKLYEAIHSSAGHHEQRVRDQ